MAMQERFREWGAGLSDEDFACALAAFGVLGAKESLSKPKRSFTWRFDPRLFTTNAADLAKAWRSFRSNVRGYVSIRLDSKALVRAGVDPYWLGLQLSRNAVGVAVLFTQKLQLRGRDPIPVLPGGGSGGGGGSYSIYEDFSPRSIGGGGGGGTDPWKPAKKAPARTRRKEAPPRFLQARIESGKRAIRGALRPGKPYSAAIRVGLPDPGWSSAGKPFPTPEEPPETKGHRLTVMFWEERVRNKPEVRTLWLPRQGSSKPVEFSFEAPADGGSIAARITVLHANRVLQTGLLKAPVGTRGRWTFELDAAPRTYLEALASRATFDAALVLDRGRALAAADGQAVEVPIDDSGVQALTRALGRKISEIADDPERYKGLESAGSVELLRELAQKGAMVHHHLCTGHELARIAGARRIHITSVKAESYFPAELLYRYRSPSAKAALCPHSLKALKAGDCTGDCPSDKRGTICPLGFWGLSKVIERHARRAGDQAQGFELRPEPRRTKSLLPISGSALLAASGKVSAFKKDAVTRLLDRLKKRGTAVLATTWDEWERYVKSKRPRLLVLLAHHDRDEDGEFLEIGDGERLETDQIWVEMVRREPGGPNPVVLLMGCETNLAEISIENPAVVFHNHGAAVVVSTIATILGRHASPATETLVQLLDKMADGKHTFGDIMLRLRQKLVATSTPMALGLTSYGDADWILTKEG
jgi:hypothetical protein